jgi:cytochrome d ubiquinol oxidase subunit II
VSEALPLFFVSAMGLSLLLYVILDGFDLGVGMLLPFGNAAEKDTMIASIGPFWDANETWIVMGVGVLLIAFPKAHGIILTALYIPVTIMLVGLILRGAAFDFRVKSADHRQPMWNKLFALGSLMASMAQGWMLGAYITGLTGDAVSVAFSILISLTLPALYIMLGGAWLLIKTEGELFDKAAHWCRLALPPMAFALLLVSIATPLVSQDIADRWFKLPDAIGLLPIPMSCALAILGMDWMLRRPKVLHAGYGWFIFVALMVICLMAAIGLAYSIYPDIVIGRMTLWEAAAATESLQFIFWGAIITLPAILGYTVYVHECSRVKPPSSRTNNPGGFGSRNSGGDVSPRFFMSGFYSSFSNGKRRINPHTNRFHQVLPGSLPSSTASPSGSPVHSSLPFSSSDSRQAASGVKSRSISSSTSAANPGSSTTSAISEFHTRERGSML